MSAYDDDLTWEGVKNLSYVQLKLLAKHKGVNIGGLSRKAQFYQILKPLYPDTEESRKLPDNALTSTGSIMHCEDEILPNSPTVEQKKKIDSENDLMLGGDRKKLTYPHEVSATSDVDKIILGPQHNYGGKKVPNWSPSASSEQKRSGGKKEFNWSPSVVSEEKSVRFADSPQSKSFEYTPPTGTNTNTNMFPKMPSTLSSRDESLTLDSAGASPSFSNSKTQKTLLLPTNRMASMYSTPVHSMGPEFTATKSVVTQYREASNVNDATKEEKKKWKGMKSFKLKEDFARAKSTFIPDLDKHVRGFNLWHYYFVLIYFFCISFGKDVDFVVLVGLLILGFQTGEPLLLNFGIVAICWIVIGQCLLIYWTKKDVASSNVHLKEIKKLKEQHDNPEAMFEAFRDETPCNTFYVDGEKEQYKSAWCGQNKYQNPNKMTADVKVRLDSWFRIARPFSGTYNFGWFFCFFKSTLSYTDDEFVGSIQHSWLKTMLWLDYFGIFHIWFPLFGIVLIYYYKHTEHLSYYISWVLCECVLTFFLSLWTVVFTYDAEKHLFNVFQRHDALKQLTKEEKPARKLVYKYWKYVIKDCGKVLNIFVEFGVQNNIAILQFLSGDTNLKRDEKFSSPNFDRETFLKTLDNTFYDVTRHYKDQVLYKQEISQEAKIFELSNKLRKFKGSFNDPAKNEEIANFVLEIWRKLRGWHKEAQTKIEPHCTVLGKKLKPIMKHDTFLDEVDSKPIPNDQYSIRPDEAALKDQMWMDDELLRAETHPEDTQLLISDNEDNDVENRKLDPTKFKSLNTKRDGFE